MVHIIVIPCMIFNSGPRSSILWLSTLFTHSATKPNINTNRYISMVLYIQAHSIYMTQIQYQYAYISLLCVLAYSSQLSHPCCYHSVLGPPVFRARCTTIISGIRPGFVNISTNCTANRPVASARCFDNGIEQPCKYIISITYIFITCFGRQSYPTYVAVFTSGLSEQFCNGLIRSSCQRHTVIQLDTLPMHSRPNVILCYRFIVVQQYKEQFRLHEFCYLHNVKSFIYQNAN